MKEPSTQDEAASGAAPPIGLIDSHQHFWDPSRGDYSWMGARHAPIRRVFAPENLRFSLAAAGVSRTILVQTWSSIAETREFLALAEATDFVAGVVGWVDLTADDVSETIDALRDGLGGRWLVGLRHQVHDESDAAWLLRDDVKRGLAAVASHGLAYDLLIRPREMEAALETAAAFPELRFVVDHIAKPDIRGGGFDAWAAKLRPFRDHRDHVWCKLSGMVTEADWASWRAEDIEPYMVEAIATFGADRCMLGSDWPVCLLAANYGETVDLVRSVADRLGAADRGMILQGSAVAAYRLDQADRLR